MNAGPDVSEEQTIGLLREQLDAALAERDEARAQQTAMSEVLQAINVSAGDPKPVFDLLVDKAIVQCGAAGGELVTFEGDIATAVSLRNVRPGLVDFWRTPQRIAGTNLEVVRRNGRTLQRPDMREVEAYQKRLPLAVAGVELGGIRTFLQVPLKSERGVVGLFMIFRHEVLPFTDRQVALLETFAAQAVLAIENARLLSEQREMLEQQTAMTEVLEVINASPGDLEPVFAETIDKAMHLCEASFGMFARYTGRDFEVAATRNVPPLLLQGGRHIPDPPAISGLGRLVKGEAVVQFVDLPNSEIYRSGFIGATALVAIGANTAIFVALRKNDVLQGAIIMYRKENRPFSDKQIALLQNFAAQAVIAMDNARLLTEQRQALEQQTATADILRVISQSPTDVTPVLEAVAAAALRFCGATDAIINLRDDDEIYVAAHDGDLPANLHERRPFDRTFAAGRAISEGRTVHIPDVAAIDRSDFPTTVALAQRYGFNASIAAPLMRDGAAVGAIVLRKKQAGAFSARQIQLLETFAAQAVIALENTRLFTELTESLDRQTATAEVLKVISQSPTNVQPVLEAVAQAAQRFCGAADVSIALRDGSEMYYATHVGPFPATVERVALDPGRSSGRAILEGRTVHLHDIRSLDPVEFAGARRLSAEVGFQASVAAPMMRDTSAIGCILLRKPEPAPFTPRQIELLETFAAQAVIAIENVRLFTELHESLERQTANTEVLQTINSSPGNVQPVFEAILAKAMTLCSAAFGTFATFNGERLQTVATQGVPEAFARYRLSNPPDYGAGTGPARLIAGEDCVHDVDAADSDAYRRGDPNRRAIVDLGGARTILNVALRKEGALLGSISIYRQEVRPFSDNQIELLQGFAAQAVIAMENARLLGEQREALERQTATADILRVINSSPGDLTPVFQAILEKAHSVCGADMGSLFLLDGANIRATVTMGYDKEIDSFLRQPRPASLAMKALIDGQRYHHLTDLQDQTDERSFGQQFRMGSQIRTNLIIPLRKDDAVLGFISANRREVRPYSEKEIGLLENFAAQAVIAMENARLLGELRDSLDQQTATADILRVISQSPNDVTPVLDEVAKAASRFCGAEDVVVLLCEGDQWIFAAHEGPMTTEIGSRQPLSRQTAPGQAMLDGTTTHFPDIAALDPVDYAAAHEFARLQGFRAALSAPMLREGRPIGAIALRKSRVGPFTNRQIELLESFAAQAVIAIENVRLFTELKESLDQQTATADILRVISQSPTDVQPVLDAVAKAAVRFCGAEDALITLRDADMYEAAAHEGPLYAKIGARIPLDERTAPGGAIIQGRTVHFPDYDALDSVEYAAARGYGRQGGFSASLAAPMLRDGAAIGAIVLRRRAAGPFAERQIALLESFAAQAVIAIENVRLFTELQRRTDDLTESLEYQTATSELLEVISRSTSDIQPALDTILTSAARLCDVQTGSAVIRSGDGFRLVATLGLPADFEQVLRERLRIPDRGSATGRALLDKSICHVPDVRADPHFTFAEAARVYPSVLGVPLLKDGEVLGAITLSRKRVGPFSDRQIALIKTFADQAVIAMENARLLGELRESLDQQTAMADVLGLINSTTGDITPIFDAMVDKATALCDAPHGVLFSLDGEVLHAISTQHSPQDPGGFLLQPIQVPPERTLPVY